jgi:hypothetical protein
MAQPGSIDVPVQIHVEVDVQPARRLVKRAIRDLEDANRELARLEDRCRTLEDRLASEYGIKIERTPT